MTATINATTSQGVVVTPDNSGNVVLQYNGITSPAFAVHVSGGLTLGYSGAQKITFDAKEFDTANSFNTGTSTYTIPVSGYWQINAQISYDPLTANEVSCFLYRNGAEYKRGTRSQASGQALYLVINTLIYANANDTLSVYTYQSSGSNKNLENLSGNGIWAGISRGNNFNGCLVRGA